MCRFLTLVAFALVFTVPATARAADASVRNSVGRSLPYLEKEGLAWINKRDCMSCHVVTFMLWAHNEARAHGVPVDAKKLAEWNVWSMNKSLSQRVFFKLTDKAIKAAPAPIQPKLTRLLDEGFTHEKDFIAALAKTLKSAELQQHQAALVKQAAVTKRGAVNDGGGLDTLTQLFLGRDLQLTNESFNKFLTGSVELMIGLQHASGLWQAAGQLPSRHWPRDVADETTTLWTILALAGDQSSEPRLRKSVARAHAAVKNARPGVNLEWIVARMLYEHRFGTPARTAELKDQLLKRQNADGGWSALPGGKSEAFSSGQSLYALRVLGDKADAAVRRGQKYLLDTQEKNGSWTVFPGLLSKGGPDRLKKLEPIHRYWGTAWAAIGLARSLRDNAQDKAEKPRAKPSLEEAYRRWDRGFSSPKKEERERTLLSMLPAEKDLHYLFPKHANKLWALWLKNRENLLRHTDDIAREITRGGPIIQIKPTNARADTDRRKSYAKIFEVIPRDVPVFDLYVRRQSGGSGSGAFLFLNDRWIWLQDLDGFPVLLDKLK